MKANSMEKYILTVPVSHIDYFLKYHKQYFSGELILKKRGTDYYDVEIIDDAIVPSLFIQYIYSIGFCVGMETIKSSISVQDKAVE